MPDFAPALAWIDAQAGAMRDLVIELGNINSNTRNLEGLACLTQALQPHLSKLESNIESIPLPAEQLIDSQGREVSLPLAPAIRLRKRASASLQVFLNIHIDTVYPKDDPFQTVEQLDANTLRGPGVIDAKGGLVVLLTALQALERSGLAVPQAADLLLLAQRHRHG